jgi:translation elongation factor EF-Tu-like GTPase
MVMPGDTVDVTVKLIVPAAMEEKFVLLLEKVENSRCRSYNKDY